MNYSAFHWAEKARKYAETVGTIFNVKGRVNTVADLPISGNKVGDLYLVGLSTDADLTEYAWLSFDGTTRWERLGYTSITNSFSALTGSPYDNTSLATALNGKQATISDLASIRSGASAGATALQPSALNGYATESWVNNKGYITGITSAMVTTALGYSPVNPTALATVATSGSYNDLSNKPTIPTVNNPTITLTQGGTTKGSFTLNQSSGATIDLDAGGSVKIYDLFDNKWTDHLLNDESWLRADTFSWQDGTVYTNAYNHLVADLGTIEETYWYAWVADTGTDEEIIVFTKSETVSVGDNVYNYDRDTIIGTVERYDTGSYKMYNTAFNYGFWRHSIEDIEQSDTSSSGAVLQTETVGSYTITYWLATDGHKICLPDQETTAANIYTESGVAWYYILDTANQRFKLPRELPITDKSKGNGMALGLTNGERDAVLGTIEGSTEGMVNVNITLPTNISTTSTSRITKTGTWGITTDPTKSGIISHRANENGKQYLYFYVGQYSQSATEQTAGLNAELFNGKMDRDMSNMNASQTAKETIVGWGLPDYTAGVSLTTTKTEATSNGCILLHAWDNGSINIYLYSSMDSSDNIPESGVRIGCQAGSSSQNSVFVPVKKGMAYSIGDRKGGNVRSYFYPYIGG